MDLLIAILTLALLAVVILVISAPLRSRAARAAALRRAAAEDRAELEAAREAKYREIRDAELDYRTGKLSGEDFAATDGALRAEAIEILDRLRSRRAGRRARPKAA